MPDDIRSGTSSVTDQPGITEPKLFLNTTPGPIFYDILCAGNY